MLNLIKKNFKQALLAFIFSGITIGSLSFLSLNTQYGLFIVGSFGATMVLVFGYPESPFSQPKNIFFGHFSYIIGWYFNFTIFTDRSIFTNCNCGRSCNIRNDITWCDSPSSRRKSNSYNSWYFFLPFSFKSNYFWFRYNYNICSYFKSSNFKKKLS